MAVILTTDEIMRKGLFLCGFDMIRQQNVKRATNLRRFKANFGSLPIVYAQIWEDLQMTEIPDAKLDENVKPCIDSFLMGIHFLKCYPTEDQQAGIFKTCEKTARKWAWFYCKKIQALKAEKIVWPEKWSDDDADNEVFIVSVDGVHCRINEPKHPTMSKNPAFYSHKFNQAGLNYELAISVFENKLVWIHGPTPAGKPDITILRECGLKDKIPNGKKAIADKGYRGEKQIMSTPNSHDPSELRTFKSRARARHESFNGRIKNFACLDKRFRHGFEKHKIVFEAICVIVQYQLENGSPLFDV